MSIVKSMKCISHFHNIYIFVLCKSTHTIMNYKTFIGFLIVLVSIFYSCKSDKMTLDVPEISALEKEYLAAPSDEKFAAIVNKLAELIQEAEGKEAKKRFILKGLSLTKEHQKTDYYYIFVKEYVKYFHGDPAAADYLWELAQYLQKNNAVESTSILRSGFRHMYPNDRRTQEIKTEIIAGPADIPGYIKQKTEAIFNNPDETGMNKPAVKEYIDVCEAVVLGFPADSMAGEYLFRAAEMARSIRAFPKSLSIYDWLLNAYPEYDKKSLVFFLRGFIYENELKDKAKAAVVYQQFLEKFPNDPMAGDVRFLLENIDKSEEEMIKLIEERQKNKNNQGQN